MAAEDQRCRLADAVRAAARAVAYRGRPRGERQSLEAIVHIACTGQAWTRLPPALGPFQACRRRFIRWRDDGTLQQISRAVLPEGDAIWQQRLAAYIGPA
ncbi:transposase [Streptomyces ziwulingensis]|uniref:Insertion element IS402-like domain-containing protein n=1 Tax=Streptomyces ziwulingensis TaxID=1045501 RepID=A0ABP9CW14_9ACTN